VTAEAGKINENLAAVTKARDDLQKQTAQQAQKITALEAEIAKLNATIAELQKQVEKKDSPPA